MKKVILLAIGACVISLATVSVFATNGEGSPKTSVSLSYISGSCDRQNGPAGGVCVCYTTTTIWCDGTATSSCAGSVTVSPNFQCTCTRQITGAFSCQ
jgi:hypothetical protein